MAIKTDREGKSAASTIHINSGASSRPQDTGSSKCKAFYKTGRHGPTNSERLIRIVTRGNCSIEGKPCNVAFGQCKLRLRNQAQPS